MRTLSGSGLRALALVACCTLGCVHPSPQQGAAIKSASIGPAGGTLVVTSNDSAALAGTSITIPAGALTEAVTITINSSAVPVVQSGDQAAGPVVDFGPDGTVFAANVLITIPVALPAGALASNLEVEAVESGGATRLIPVISQAAGFATFPTASFTRFGGVIHLQPVPDAGPASDAGPVACASDSDCPCAESCFQGQCVTEGAPCSTDAGPVICNCPSIPAGGCTVAGPPPCNCPTATSCGDGGTCTSNSDCPADSFCSMLSCFGSGNCAPRPQTCEQTCASPELCGCDGNIYCNSCLANAAGTTTTTCEGPQCTGNSDCGTCEVCTNGVCEAQTSCAVDAGPAGGGLAWFNTCGNPVCDTSTDAGVVADAGACPAIGTPCTNAGATCGTATAANCGVTEICSATNPAAGPCPISSRKFKSDIQYLDAPALQKVHDEVLQTKLATFHYKTPYGDPEPNHLGFIIEDQAHSPSVDQVRSGVDIYNYLSMVVASMQVQEQEIRQLRRELDETRKGVCGARGK